MRNILCVAYWCKHRPKSTLVQRLLGTWCALKLALVTIFRNLSFSIYYSLQLMIQLNYKKYYQLNNSFIPTLLM